VLAALGDGSIDVFSLILSYRLGRIPAHESAASQVFVIPTKVDCCELCLLAEADVGVYETLFTVTSLN
jgi:hypothetical protein